MTTATRLVTAAGQTGQPRRCEVLGRFPLSRCCRRVAVVSVLWDNGNDSDMCATHAALLDDLDWKDTGRGEWVAPVTTTTTQSEQPIRPTGRS